MTSTARECDLKRIGLDNYVDEPSPLKGNNMELHTNHKGSTFNMFLLLKKYHNNPRLNLVLDLAIDSKELHFMVLFMRRHNTNA